MFEQKKESNISIPRQKEFDEILGFFKEAGAGKLYVLADFDNTLTKAFVGGKRVPSLISVLRGGDYLSPEYRKKAHALYEKYHAFENDQRLSLNERKEKMQEWWKEHFDLLISCGLRKDDLNRVINESGIELREGAKEFFATLQEKGVPLIIISSSGIGDIIELILVKNNVDLKNIKIITNRFNYDENGKVISVKQPVIHSLNKDETSFEEETAQTLVGRNNVILLGDSLGDTAMMAGRSNERVLKVGFLNEKISEQKQAYEQNFDAIVVNDGDLSLVNRIINKIK